MDTSDGMHHSDSHSSDSQSMRIIVCPATGGQFDIEIDKHETVEELLKRISRHLQTPRDRLKVLHKDKVLSSGNLSEYDIRDGNKVTLLPAIESGFSSTVQGTQQSIIQAIESLSDVQIDDFLSGRSPLTLALRVGDHMMFVQLQLEQSVAQSNASHVSRGTSSTGHTTSGHHHTPRSHRPLFSQLSAYPPPRAVTQNSPEISFMPPSSFPAHSQTDAASLSTSLASHHATSSRLLASPTTDMLQKSVSSNEVASIRGPTTGLVCKPATANNIGALNHSLPHPLTVEGTSHIDKLVSTCSSVGASENATPEVAPASGSCKNLDKKSCLSNPSPAHALLSNSSARGSSSSQVLNSESGIFSNCKPSAQDHRRFSTTSGKITSGVGSLSNHGSSMSGTKVVRQMQRLRRLCGSHQQCVAYSSPELASEISSIVHAARHHSGLESNSNSSHRRCSKTSSRDRVRASPSAAKPVKPPASGACIDTFTAHGPGIFSGTFSGSLHPNIQDKEGRPKRDPQTILQILTDLLSATNQYQGQTGNIGILPQLLRDHFAMQQAESGNTPSSSAPTSSTSSSDQQDSKSNRTHHSLNRFQPYSHNPNYRHHHHHHLYAAHQVQSHSRMTYGRNAPCYPYLTPPGHGIPPHYPVYSQMSPADQAAAAAAAYHYARSSESALALSAHQHRPLKCWHRREESLKHARSSSRSQPSFGNAGSSSRRSCKHAVNINVSRLRQLHEENRTTRNKMRELTEKLQQRRLRRQLRREACGPYSRTGSVNLVTSRTHDKGSEPNGLGSNNVDTHNESADVEVQMDDLSDFPDGPKAEVAHESPETVTV